AQQNTTHPTRGYAKDALGRCSLVMHLLISDTVLHPCENYDEKEQDDSLCTRIPDLVPHECILVDLIHDKVCCTCGPSSGEDVNLAERLEGVDHEHNAHEEQDGESSGRVTCRNCRRRFAPSIAALSYSSVGTAWSPPRSTMKVNPICIHIVVIATDTRAIRGSVNHPKVGNP